MRRNVVPWVLVPWGVILRTQFPGQWFPGARFPDVSEKFNDFMLFSDARLRKPNKSQVSQTEPVTTLV